MDEIIKKILEKIEENGFSAYLVGGYVRDMMLGISSIDVDICTNALPKDLYALFDVAANNYGGVNLKIDKYNIDITTFRIDKNYVNRRPSEVIYIDSLEDDLKRRDFTVNAICMDKNGKIIDLVGGIEDLNQRVIRMIGAPNEKIKEDPLRILRAIRFATILDFAIDPILMDAIKNNYGLVGSLSKKRVRDELDKILINKNYSKGLKILKDTKILDVLNISYTDINYVEDLVGMWAQLKVKDIPFTNNEKSNIIKIAEVVSTGSINRETLYKYGLYINTIAGKILNISPKNVGKMYGKLPIKSREEMDISSEEIMSVLNISPGKEMKDIYNDLVENILNGKVKNKNKEIKKYLIKRK